MSSQVNKLMFASGYFTNHNMFSFLPWLSFETFGCSIIIKYVFQTLLWVTSRPRELCQQYNKVCTSQSISPQHVDSITRDFWNICMFPCTPSVHRGCCQCPNRPRLRQTEKRKEEIARKRGTHLLSVLRLCSGSVLLC